MVSKIRIAATNNFIRWWDNFNESRFTGGETGNEGPPLSSLAGPGPPGVVSGAHPRFLGGVEAEEGDADRVRVPVDAEDAAVLPGFVVLPDGRVFGFRFSVEFMGQSGQLMRCLYLVLVFSKLSYFGSEV